MCKCCICDGCEKFACCHCGCDSCSRKCFGCTICTTFSLCVGLFLLYLLLGIIISFLSKDKKNDYYDPDSDICRSIEFKPQYLKCNINNVLYIILSLVAEGDNIFHSLVFEK